MISSMTLKRLMIVLGILVFLAGIGIMWLWQYAYSPEGRARVIIAQLKGDSDTTLRGWMLQHRLIRLGFPDPPMQSDSDVISHDDDCEVAAEGEMIKLGPKGLPIAIGALKDKNQRVRLMAVRVCGNFRDPAVTPQLIDLLEDSDGRVLYSCVRALGKLKDKRVTDALIRHLSDPEDGSGTNIYIKGIAAESLGEIGDPKAIPSLLKLLNDEDIRENVRLSASGALAKIGQEEVAKFVLTLLKSPKWYDREEAVELIGRLRIKGSLEMLLSALEERHVFVRRSAVRALGELKDPSAIPALRKLLKDSEPDVRTEAEYALQGLGLDKIPPASQPGTN
jgi:hypothetical protein